MKTPTSVGRPGPVATFRLIAAISSRMLRWRRAKHVSALILLTGVILTVLYSTLAQLALSGQQVADRDLGRFSSSIGFGALSIPPGNPGLSSVLPERDSAGNDLFPTLSILGVSYENESVEMREADWSQNPFPDTYRLTVGTWANEPGEVTLYAGRRRETQRVGDTVQPFGSTTKLRVVGIAQDLFPSDRAGMLVGPGTYESIDPAVAEQFQAISASPVIFSQTEYSGKLAKLLQSLWVPYAKETSATLSGNIADSVVLRSRVVGSKSDDWITQNPIGYKIPALILPAVAVIVAGSAARQEGLERTRRLRHIGIGAVTARTSLWTVFSFYQFVALVTSAFLGWMVSFAARPLIGIIASGPLSEVPTPVDPLLRILFSTISALIVGFFILGDSPSRPTSFAPARALITRAGDFRHIALAISASAALVAAVKLNSPQSAMWFTVVVSVPICLVVPDLIHLAGRGLRDNDPSQRLAARIISADRTRSATSVILLGSVMGLGLSLLALINALAASANGDNFPDVLRGQALVVDRSTPILAPSQTSLDVVTAQLPTTNHFSLGFVTNGLPGKAQLRAELSDAGQYILALNSPEEVGELLGRPLTQSETTTLLDEGLLVWNKTIVSPGVTASHNLRLVQKRQTISEALLRTQGVEPPSAGWRLGKDGVMLRSTAEKLLLPVSRGAEMFSGLSSSENRRLEIAVGAAGIDPETIETFKSPDLIRAPVTVAVTISGLLVFALLVLLVDSRLRVSTLSAYGQALSKLGIPRMFVRKVFLIQQGVVLTFSIAIAILIGCLPLLIAAFVVDSQYVITIPWSSLGICVTAVVIASVTATASAFRKL